MTDRILRFDSVRGVEDEEVYAPIPVLTGVVFVGPDAASSSAPCLNTGVMGLVSTRDIVTMNVGR